MRDESCWLVSVVLGEMHQVPKQECIYPDCASGQGLLPICKSCLLADPSKCCSLCLGWPAGWHNQLDRNRLYSRCHCSGRLFHPEGDASRHHTGAAHGGLHRYCIPRGQALHERLPPCCSLDTAVLPGDRGDGWRRWLRAVSDDAYGERHGWQGGWKRRCMKQSNYGLSFSPAPAMPCAGAAPCKWVSNALSLHVER